MTQSRVPLAVCLAWSCWLLAASQADDRDARTRRMSQRVDQLLAIRQQAEGATPVFAASDSEFLRRVYLDLTGVVPRVSEARGFIESRDDDKRRALINRLLDSPRHATHMANIWRQIMLPGSLDLNDLRNVAGVQNWLRRQFATNLRYDRIVRAFLVATGGGESGPALYYTSLELRPEKLAASTSRIFLGLQIECAECHAHPFDRWTQEDFWGYAAFFARLDQSNMNAGGAVVLEDRPAGEVTLPDTQTVVFPKYPGGRSADADEGGTRREQLAIWMASRDNPFLARAAVNRTWAHMFGTGLVEPVDDLGPHNPPSHPQLMEELTEYFVDLGFDLRELLRMLANTDAYQRTSRVQGVLPPDRLFASMAVKTLTADQLYDSLARVLSRPAGGSPSPVAAVDAFDPERVAFAARMQLQGASATEYDAGVLQALKLINGSEVTRLTDGAQSGLLMALSAPWMSDGDRLETLFLATLSRLPSAEERASMMALVEEAGTPDGAGGVWGDLLWALLNSAEFCFNH